MFRGHLCGLDFLFDSVSPKELRQKLIKNKPCVVVKEQIIGCFF